MTQDVETIPNTYAHCLRCGTALETNYPGLCRECLANLAAKARSYGGYDSEIEQRFESYLAEYAP